MQQIWIFNTRAFLNNFHGISRPKTQSFFYDCLMRLCSICNVWLTNMRTVKRILQCSMVELWGVNPNESSKGQTKWLSKHGHKLTFFTDFLILIVLRSVIDFNRFLQIHVASAIWISSVLQTVFTLLVIMFENLVKLMLWYFFL